MRKEAYWITPDGEVIKVKTTHIDEVIRNPELFGLNIEDIKALYKKYDEPLGLEGKAREEIMLNLILVGWIRIRWKPKEYSYTVQMKQSPETETNLKNWFEILAPHQKTLLRVVKISLKANMLMLTNQITLLLTVKLQSR